jgi:hypothetical protein
MIGPSDYQYVQAARRLHDKEGECEVDEYEPKLTQVSRGADLGAYVMAWVWVPEDEAEKEDAEES